MHGKRREEYKAKLRDDKTAAALAHKANQWHALCKGLAERRQRAQTTPTPATTTTDNNNDPKTILQETQTLLEKALMVNPDPNHLWNHRRELLLLHDGDLFDLTTELKLIQAALTRNPKAYGAWFHRKWCLATSKQATDIHLWEKELALTAQLLQLDERNFHCWNYRRFVVSGLLQGGTFQHQQQQADKLMCGTWNVVGSKCGVEIPMGAQLVVSASTSSASDDNNNSNHGVPTAADVAKLLQAEWDFSTQKIHDNFSNFSAFHYRSALLPWKLQFSSSADDSNNTNEQLMEEELQLVENAFCTEPDDQTSWWYHAFLLDMIDNDTSSLFSVDKERLQEQAALLRDLQEDSPGKWVLLGLHRLLRSIGDDTVEEQLQVLKQLSIMDPDRNGRYQNLMQQCSTALSQ